MNVDNAPNGCKGFHDFPTATLLTALAPMAQKYEELTIR